MGAIKSYRNCFFTIVLIVLHFFCDAVQAQKFSFVSTIVNRAALNTKYEYHFAALDSNNKTINFNCSNLPAWISFNKKNNSLSGVAKKAGQFFIQLNATNGDTIIHQKFMLTVYDKQTMNILPLGNSITNGVSVYNSYRRYLWQLLHNDNYNFDFIGSWDKHHMGSTMPDEDFDTDNDGHSGWTAHHILAPPDWDKQRGNLDKWLLNYTPDIVLIELGTNDVFQCVKTGEAMNDLSTIIDKLRKKNAAVKILMAQIPPLGNEWAPKKLCGTDTSYDEALKLFNKAIVDLVNKKNTNKSRLIIVDQFTNVNPATDMFDDIHPNTKGEIKMAERWFKALQPFLKKLK